MPFISKHRIAKYTGIPYAFNWFYRQRVLVVAYHGFFDRAENSDKFPQTFVHVNNFRSQLLFLKNNYHIIRPEILLEAIVENRSLPDHAALVTFDDAYANFYRLAVPLLQTMGIAPIVFVPTLYVEKRVPFWYDFVWFFLLNGNESDRRWFLGSIGLDTQSVDKADLAEICLAHLKRKTYEERNSYIEPLRERVNDEKNMTNFMKSHFLAMNPEQIHRLSELGFHFGGHTHTHTVLTAMDRTSAQNEIIQNKSCLESIIGKKVHFFAYPNGGIDDFDNRHKQILIRAGYVSSFSLIQRRSSHLSEPMAIGRINVAPEDSLESLWFRCAGISPIVKKIRQYFGI